MVKIGQSRSSGSLDSGVYSFFNIRRYKEVKECKNQELREYSMQRILLRGREGGGEGVESHDFYIPQIIFGW